MSHENFRKCFDCKHIAYYYDDILPYCKCHKCGSEDTRKMPKPPGCLICMDSGVVDSGGSDEAGRFIDVPCECRDKTENDKRIFNELQRYHAATSDKDLIDVLCVGLTEYIKKLGSQSTTIEIENYCRITVEALQNVSPKTLG